MQQITITSRTPNHQPSITTIRNTPAHVARTIATLKNKQHTDIQVQTPPNRISNLITK